MEWFHLILEPGAIIGCLVWVYLDNRRGHKNIYEKLHEDHNNLMDKLLAMSEKLGGKADK